MNHKPFIKHVLIVFILLVTAACAQATPEPADTPAPAEVEVTREITRVVEGTPVVETTVERVVVTATPAEEEVEEDSTEGEVSLPLDRAVISLSSKLNNLDPADTPTVQPDIVTMYFTAGRLFRLNLDWTWEPELAESFEVSEDGLTATVILKEGLQYSDGTPIVAEDVVFAYQRHVDQESPFAFLFTPVESVEAPDERTVVFNLQTPYLDLPLALGHMAMGIHPQEQVESDPDYFSHPVSSGRYMIKDWSPGANEWVLEENPNWVGGQAAIREVEFQAIPDLTSRVLQLSTGSVDYVYDLPVSARESFPEEVETYPVPIIGMYHVVFNGGLPADHPLQDNDVRHAISLAIDRHELNDIAFQGISTPATGFMYPRVEEGLDVLPNGGEQDLEAARERLAQSSFPDGFDVTLQTWGQRPGWTEAALVIQENLAEIGINVEVEPIEDAVAIANLQAGDFEMQFSGNTQDPITFLKNQFTPGTFWGDAARYDNPEVTRLLNEAQAAVTREERIELLHEAQRLAFEDLPLIPISERVVLVGNRVGRDIIIDANRPPGVNPAVADMADLSQ